MLNALTKIFRRGTAKRSYDGASAGRRWRGVIGMPNQPASAAEARGPAARRARYMAGNNAHAAAAVEALVSAIVGTGIKPQSLHPDPDVRRGINEAFEAWTDRADADDLLDFYGLLALAVRRLVIDGECFFLVIYDLNGRVQYRALDSEQVDASNSRPIGDGAGIVQGVEIDAGGRRVAYHVYRERPGLPFGQTMLTDRVAAEHVIHLYRPEAPGQVRGLTWFIAVLLRLADLDATHDAQLVRQKIGALLTGFITSPEGDTLGFGETPAGQGIEEGGLEPGTLKVLRPGQDVRFSEPAKIGSESIEFMTLSAREIAAGLGVPYSAISGNYSDANYSSLRAELVAFRRRVEAIQHHVVVHRFCRPIFRQWLTAEVMAGRLDLPGFFENPEPYFAVKWITPRNDWVDPAKDVAAEIEAINAGLMSRREAVASRGYDIEALDEEIAADHDRETRLGLVFTAPLRNHEEETANA